MQTRPDPGSATTAEEFLEALRQLRTWAGQPSLRTLNALGGTDPDSGVPPADLLPVSTLSDNLAGKRLPNPPRLSFVVAFVTACMRANGSHTPEEIADEADRWTQAWLALSPAAPQPPAPEGAPAAENTVLENAPAPDDTLVHHTPAPEDAAPENSPAQDPALAPPTPQRTKRRLPVMAWLLGVATGAVIVGLITLVTTDAPPQRPAASNESTDVTPAPRTPPPPTRPEPTASETTSGTPVHDHDTRTVPRPAPTPSTSISKRPPSSPSRPAPSKSPSKSPTPAPYPSYYDSWKTFVPTFPPRP